MMAQPLGAAEMVARQKPQGSVDPAIKVPQQVRDAGRRAEIIQNAALGIAEPSVLPDGTVPPSGGPNATPPAEPSTGTPPPPVPASTPTPNGSAGPAVATPAVAPSVPAPTPSEPPVD